MHADYTTEKIGMPLLDITFVAASNGAEARGVKTADCQAEPWELPYKVGVGDDSTRYGREIVHETSSIVGHKESDCRRKLDSLYVCLGAGVVLSKEFQLPDDFGHPGALSFDNVSHVHGGKLPLHVW